MGSFGGKSEQELWDEQIEMNRDADWRSAHMIASKMQKCGNTPVTVGMGTASARTTSMTPTRIVRPRTTVGGGCADMGWLFGKYKDPAHPFGTDNPPPASPGIEAAIRRLEQRRGYPVRDGEHVLPWWPWSERGD